MLKKLPLLFFLFISSALSLQAQDMQFTQFYAAPTYLNPAFTGMHGCTRLSSNYRVQWPSIPGAFVSNIVALDHSLVSYNSGVGLMFTNDRAGSGKLRSTTYNLLYSYEAQLSRQFSVRGGLQGAYAIRDINFYQLVFGDQIARNNPVTIEVPTMEKTSFLDFATGIVGYSKDYWMGLSLHHLTRPNEALATDNKSPLPRKFSAHAGARIPLNEVEKEEKYFSMHYILPALNYKSQGKFDQLDIGFYYDYSPMIVGLWYRGIPLFKSYQKGYPNNDAVALIAGFTVEQFKFGYSYDFTISRLISSTAGSHEISLSYQVCSPKKKRKKRLIIPCPKF